MKIKQSYITELLVLLLAGISGIMIYKGGWIISILGFVILFFDSYVLVSVLKRNTVEEYEIHKRSKK